MRKLYNLKLDLLRCTLPCHLSRFNIFVMQLHIIPLTNLNNVLDEPNGTHFADIITLYKFSQYMYVRRIACHVQTIVNNNNNNNKNHLFCIIVMGGHLRPVVQN